MPKFSPSYKTLFDGVMEKAKKLIKEIPKDNPTACLVLDVPLETPRIVEEEICEKLEKMGWENIQVLAFGENYTLTFMRK